MYLSTIKIDTDINVENFDKLTIQKIRKITSIEESSISFLQNLKLLSITSKNDDNCGQFNSYD